jgi:hypothetical protein
VKVLGLPLRVLFVAVYVGGNIVFNYYLGIIDYGGLPSGAETWAVMVLGGTLAGVLALGVEGALNRGGRIWPASVLGFMLRAILMADIWLSVAYTLTALLALLREVSLPGAGPAALAASLAAVPMLFVYMLGVAGMFAPFLGLSTGLIWLYGTRKLRHLAPAAATRS